MSVEFKIPAEKANGSESPTERVIPQSSPSADSRAERWREMRLISERIPAVKFSWGSIRVIKANKRRGAGRPGWRLPGPPALLR